MGVDDNGSRKMQRTGMTSSFAQADWVLRS